MRRTDKRLDTTGVRLGETSGLLDTAEQALIDSTRTFMDRMSTVLRRRARTLRDETTLVARYTTGSHTANLVPLFAVGPGAEQFAGVIDNHQIGQILLDTMRR